jgi:hypothetical protein
MGSDNFFANDVNAGGFNEFTSVFL